MRADRLAQWLEQGHEARHTVAQRGGGDRQRLVGRLHGGEVITARPPEGGPAGVRGTRWRGDVLNASLWHTAVPAGRVCADLEGRRTPHVPVPPGAFGVRWR